VRWNRYSGSLLTAQVDDEEERLNDQSWQIGLREAQSLAMQSVPAGFVTRREANFHGLAYRLRRAPHWTTTNQVGFPSANTGIIREAASLQGHIHLMMRREVVGDQGFMMRIDDVLCNEVSRALGVDPSVATAHRVRPIRQTQVAALAARLSRSLCRIPWRRKVPCRHGP